MRGRPQLAKFFLFQPALTDGMKMTRPNQVILYVLGIILGLGGLAILLLGLGGAVVMLAYSDYRVQDIMLVAVIVVVATSVGVALIYCANRAIDRANVTPTDAP